MSLLLLAALFWYRAIPTHLPSLIGGGTDHDG
jgi:hypothetical protein